MHNCILFELERTPKHLYVGDAITGVLYMNGVAICRTLENAKYAIPTGRFAVDYCDSPKFGRKLPLIHNETDCHATRGLRIHAGNSISDTQGCILVGRDFKWISDHTARLLESKVAVETLCKIIELNPKRPMALIIYEE